MHRFSTSSAQKQLIFTLIAHVISSRVSQNFLERCWQSSCNLKCSGVAVAVSEPKLVAAALYLFSERYSLHSLPLYISLGVGWLKFLTAFLALWAISFLIAFQKRLYGLAQRVQTFAETGLNRSSWRWKPESAQWLGTGWEPSCRTPLTSFVRNCIAMWHPI